MKKGQRDLLKDLVAFHLCIHYITDKAFVNAKSVKKRLFVVLNKRR